MGTDEPLGATVLGYPRIGPNRELKRALEDHWAGRIDEAELAEVGRALRADTWTTLRDAGLGSVPSNTFSYYDHVLDTAELFGVLPERYRTGLSGYFAAARGDGDRPALELTKWFDTNYHYLVPEIGPDTRPTLAGDKPLAEYAEALALGVPTRPVLLGPVTFLLLAKPTVAGYRPLDALDPLLDAYAALLTALARAGARWVQLDEPAFVTDRSEGELAALERAYRRLGGLAERPALLVAGYFGDLGPALPVLAGTPVEGLAVDLVSDPSVADRLVAVPKLADKTLVAGVVDGRNVWRTDLDRAFATCLALRDVAGHVTVGTSCPALHVPYDVRAEPDLGEVGGWLAFARQKVDEVVVLDRALRFGLEVVAEPFATARAARAERAHAASARDDRVRARLAGVHAEHTRRAPYPERAAVQAEALGLPDLPTTTIGSFPQTREVRATRAAYRAGRIDAEEYRSRMRAEIDNAIELQERAGLDVLVHGEPERDDMVAYFAERLAGFVTTRGGWVQSYGSRCVRPPILYGDVSRPEAMTVEWATYARSRTDRPVKGMLTGPVTMLAWSFVRDDQPLADTAAQVALAIRDEARDLEAAGVPIIQVDEPALRESLPPTAGAREEYLRWAVTAFRLATSGVADRTQIHTHMCYSEFGDILSAIDELDADVTSVEAARSRMEVLDDLKRIGFERGIGPGVYDIHSPRVPSVEELAGRIRAARAAVPANRLWVNPDCGLKTRTNREVEPALRNLVAAARAARSV